MPPPKPKPYDLIIIGGGIAGLRTGLNALEINPDIKCCILEKYWYIGGRIATYRKNLPNIGKVQWENGAGRISTTHHKVLYLLKKYGLTFIPIDGTTNFIDSASAKIEKNTFTDLIDIYLAPLKNLPKDILQSHTLAELLHKTVGVDASVKFYEQFPYYSEIHTLRADRALISFDNEMESNNGFGVVKEGFSALTDKMKSEFVAKGGEIILNTPVHKIVNNPDNSITVEFTHDNKHGEYKGNTVVLALHHSAITKISGVNRIPVLKHLTMAPLLRIYAIFRPQFLQKKHFLEKSVTKTPHFLEKNMAKCVTDSPIRYIIPITRGIIMISYTDGNDTRHWNKYSEKELKGEIMREIRKLFPTQTIPDPIFIKKHDWSAGCTYWLPGNYDVEEESRKSLHPLPKEMPRLFMCGESFAVNQCWVESALDQADKLVTNSNFAEKINTQYKENTN